MFHAVWYLISVMSWFFLNICNYFLLTLVEFGLLPGVLPCLFSPILLFCLMFNFLHLCTMCCSRFMRNQGDILWWWWSACMFVYNQHISHFLSKKNLPPYTLLSSYRTWNNIWLEILTKQTFYILSSLKHNWNFQQLLLREFNILIWNYFYAALNILNRNYPKAEPVRFIRNMW